VQVGRGGIRQILRLYVKLINEQKRYARFEIVKKLLQIDLLNLKDDRRF
jgi:hypothetical protein